MKDVRKSLSIIKILDDENSFMILNPSKPESIQNITPIPKTTELGLPINTIEENSKSNLVEIIPFECSCGRELGIYLRIISIQSLLNKDFNKDIMTGLNLGGCCRMKILGPIIGSVISLDINAKVVDGYEIVEGGYKWPEYNIF